MYCRTKLLQRSASRLPPESGQSVAAELELPKEPTATLRKLLVGLSCLSLLWIYLKKMLLKDREEKHLGKNFF